jgi:hypothetical protein
MSTDNDRQVLTYTDENGKPADETRATRMTCTSGGVVKHESVFLDEEGNAVPQPDAWHVVTTVYDEAGHVVEVRDSLHDDDDFDEE